MPFNWSRGGRRELPRRTPGAILRRARKRRGWSQTRLIHELRRASNELGHGTLPENASLASMLSRWENDHRAPDPRYRSILCRALGIEVSDLGLPEDEDLSDDW